MFLSKIPANGMFQMASFCAAQKDTLLHMQHREDLELLAAGCSGGKQLHVFRYLGEFMEKKIYSQQPNKNIELLVQGVCELPGEDTGQASFLVCPILMLYPKYLLLSTIGVCQAQYTHDLVWYSCYFFLKEFSYWCVFGPPHGQ